MANLRIVEINASDSRTIKVRFTENLSLDLTAQNVSVTALSQSIPDAKVRSVYVDEDVLIITVLPLTPFEKYRVTFKDAPGVKFKSKSGLAFIMQDGLNNVAEVLGAEDPNNIYRDNLIQALVGQPYVPENGTIVRKYFNEITTNFLKARNDIKQAKNDNYLGFTIKDERKTRSFGPFDRLNEEGAYEIIRVGLTPENETIPGSLYFDSFPSDIISLQLESISSEQLTAGEGSGTFNNFVLTVSKKPVIKLKSLIIAYQGGNTYEYDIRTYGYRIKDSKYDTEHASLLLTLDDNQFELSEEVFDDPNFTAPGAGDVIIISYDYKSLGKNVNEDSVSVTQILESVREVTPALANEFSLKYFPIVNNNGAIPSSGGVQFLDPESSNPFNTTHPAFLIEIPFKANALPRNPGEYSIDYEHSRVFVYGEDENGLGTGYFPPATTYKYKKSFRRDLDYTYRPETQELVASPLRELSGTNSKIEFMYEVNLVPDSDYKAHVHKEVLSERIENRLLSSNSFKVLNSPVTNVFRIYNETSGEIYRLNRFIGDKVIFSASTPPRILNSRHERSSFKSIVNEMLIPSQEMVNVLGTRIFKINLLNKNIISATEDVIGSSYNTSVQFSRSDIFQTELFYEGQVNSVTSNINRLHVNEYQIDYRNGIVYVGVDVSQNYSVGTINYKAPFIKTNNPHIMAVSDVYYSINPVFGISKKINYSSFYEGYIVPDILDVSDERFLNSDTSIPYTVNGYSINVQDDIKTVRHVFDNYDLINNSNPVDFGVNAEFTGNVIQLSQDGIELVKEYTVQAGLEIDIDTGSPGISLNSVISCINVSNDAQYIDGYEGITGNTITLSGSSGATQGDIVRVIYTVILNANAAPIVDYDRGEHFVDYTYLADEIIVSYEYGDNSIDFRESEVLDPGDIYYVSYKAGALRDSLLDNFGSLIDIAELNTFDVNLDRERYRDALAGALQSFTRGPTIPSMKDLVAEVTKIKPEITEAMFQYWALGISFLHQNAIKMNFVEENTHNRTLVPAVFDNGYLPTKEGDYVSFPVSSNLSLNAGTIEFDVIPMWDGLDNDAVLTFKELKIDGNYIDASDIYIGSSSYNPVMTYEKTFDLSRFDDVVGVPSAIHTETGLFIYYDDQVKRWNFLAKSDPNDGYYFTGKIVSSGEVYDVKGISDVLDSDDWIRSGNKTIDFGFNINATDVSVPDGYSFGDGYVSGYSFDGISFMADAMHYFVDFGESTHSNRFSIFKDGRGYLNFCVFDKNKTRYVVSADIQHWEAHEHHNIGASWRLDTKNKMDEIHLFIDGFEVPNIIRYGGAPSLSATDRFRTVVPEIVAGTVIKDAVAGKCSTELGSTIITAHGIDFSLENINIGDVIQIKEQGFTTYIITDINASQLTLNTPMPASLSDARFTINPFSTVVSSEIDLYPNIVVSKLIGGVETEIPGVRADVPGYSISKNALNQNILTIEGFVEAGSQIIIRTLGLNHRRCRENVYLWNAQSVLKTQLPPPVNLDEVSIRSVILPYTVVGPNNATVSGSDFEITLNTTEISNDTEGRQLEIRISGGNVDFTNPVSVTINGTSNAGSSETLTFSSAEKQITVNKWMVISSVDVVCTPVSLSKNSIGIEIKEAYSVTTSNGNNIYPVIRYAYQMHAGTNLSGDGSDVVTDTNGTFRQSDVGNVLVIESPVGPDGSYNIIEFIDNNTVRLDNSTSASFIDGTYKVYNVTNSRTGFQNGFFFLELAGSAGIAYNLPAGYYEFDYSVYISAEFDPVNDLEFYLGSDFNGKNQANAIIDEFRILNRQLTDTRVGESVGDYEQSITTGVNKISEFKKDINTLVLLHFNSYPLVNDSDYYSYYDRKYIQSADSVNANFGQSIVFEDRGIGFDSQNRLTTNSEGTIEFWVSPELDTYNDPFTRVYFDAAASVVEETVSLTKASVMVSGRASEILSVRLASDIDGTGINYFENGSISNDFQTINLGRALPFQQIPVRVAYIPTGLVGNRMTILKDNSGYLCFNIISNQGLYQVRQPIFWSRNTWHKVKVTFLMNSKNNLDLIKLSIDGGETTPIKFGEGYLFGSSVMFGQIVQNVGLLANIDFTDIITRFYIGQDYAGGNVAKARIDNFRLSNKALNDTNIAGNEIDINWNSNLENVYPVIENAYTTMLLDFGSLLQKVKDFSILRDATYGVFNFDLDVIDSFRIVDNSEKVREMLEAMIMALKPANSKVNIRYVR